MNGDGARASLASAWSFILGQPGSLIAAAVLAVILRVGALGADDAGKVFVVFWPGTAPAEAFAAIVAKGTYEHG